MPVETSALHCEHMNYCGGCTLLRTPYEEQKAKKLKRVSEVLGTKNLVIDYHSIGLEGFRERTDLSLKNGVIGFYKKSEAALFSLNQCPLFTEDLQQALQALQKHEFPFSQGSFRLRTNAQNEWGLWIDFSHKDTLELLQNHSSTLESLLEAGFHIEIGQKFKTLKRNLKKSHGWSLQEPELKPWAVTFVKGHSQPLFGSIGHFTQTGAKASFVIAGLIEKALAQNQLPIFEFGAGLGTWSLPLAHLTPKLTAVDFSASVLTALKYNCELVGLNSVKIEHGDYRKQLEHINEHPVVFVNPARSGVGDLFATASNKKIKKIMYLSCHLESLQTDVQKLNALGFKIDSVDLIDQFPHTEHIETLVQLSPV